MSPRRGRLAALAAALLLAAGAAQAGPWSGIYDRATLRHWQAEFRPGVEAVLDQLKTVIPARPGDRRLGQLALDLPEEADGGDHPFNFYINLQVPGRPVMHLPVASLRLLGDVCLAWAWLSLEGRPTAPVDNFVKMLRLHGVAALAGRPPLAVMGVPDDVRTRPGVAERTQQLFGSAVAFVIGHELGHLMADAVPADPIARESAADAYALGLMRQIGALPIGATAVLTIQAHLDDASLRTKGAPTHPPSPERLQSLARGIRAGATDFLRTGHSIASVARLAAAIDGLGRTLADTGVQDALRRVGRSVDPAPPPVAPAGADPIAGRWRGRWTDARGQALDATMELWREGDRVAGRWFFEGGPSTPETVPGLRVAQGRLEGHVADGRLHLAWALDDDKWGRAVLQAGRGLSGTWGYDARDSGAGRWEFAR